MSESNEPDITDLIAEMQASGAVPEPPPEKPKKAKPPKAQSAHPGPVLPPEPPPASRTIIDVAPPPAPEKSPPPEEPDTLVSMVKSALQDFNESAQEIMGCFRADRAEAQRVVSYLEHVVVDREVINTATGTVPPIYVESLVKALEVKANISLTVVKLLDSKTKLLAAAKGGLTINNNNSIGGAQNAELQDMLNQPLENDLDE